MTVVVLLLVAGAVGLWPRADIARRRRTLPGRGRRVSRPRAGALAGRLRARPPETSPQQACAAALLVAACLEAGATPASALRQAAASGEPSVRATLTAAADEVEAAGVRPPALAGDPWRPVGAVFGRSLLSGSAMSGQLIEAAEQLRDEAHFVRLERARRVGVLSALPLGGCLLPAFVLLAVVPAVVGLSTTF